jgi:two-component sensor histidine kinase
MATRPRFSDGTVLLAEFNHRLFNTLQIIASVISECRRNSGGEASTSMLADLETRLAALAQLHRRLAMPRFDKSFEDHCRALCGLLVRAFGRDDVKSWVIMETLTLTDEQAFRLSLLVVELVTNVLKHSLADEPGTVWVDLRCVRGQIELSVSDSRKSPLANFGPSQIVRLLAQDLDGEAFVVDNAGCVAGVRLPAAAPGLRLDPAC